MDGRIAAAAAAVDVLLVALAAAAAIWFWRQGHAYEDWRRRGFWLILGSLVLAAVIYALHLSAMVLLPSLMLPEDATALIETFHMSFSWHVPAVSISLLVFALFQLGRDMIALLDSHRAASEHHTQSVYDGEQAFRGLFEDSVRGIFIRQNGRAVFANQAFADLYGYSDPKHILELASTDQLIAPDDRTLVRDNRMRREAGEPAPTLYEFRGLRRDGTVFWVENEAQLIRWRDEPAVLTMVSDVSDRYEAQEALRVSQERLERAQRVAHIGSWEKDYLTDTLTWSDEIYRIFGLEAGQFEATSAEFDKRVHPDDLAALRAAVDRTITEDAPYSLDHRIIRPDGEVRRVHEHGEAVFLGDGTIQKIIGTVQDITERTRAEEALVSSEFAFRQLLEGASQGIFIRQGGKAVFANQAFADLYGYHNPGEILALGSIEALETPDNRIKFQEFRRRRAEGQEVPEVYEFEGLRKDGSTVWLENHVQAVTWNGTPGRLVIVSDVSARHAVQEALRASRESLARAQQLAHLGNWDWDITTDALEWSDEIYRIFGYEPQEFEANYPEFLNRIHPEDRSALEAAVARAVAGEAPYSIDHRVIRPDGEVRAVYEQGEVIFGDDGAPLQMIGIVHDITEQSRVEEVLRESELRLGSIAENIPGGIFRRVLHPDGEIEYPYLSARAHGLAGIHPHDLDGMVRAIHKSAELFTVFDQEHREVSEDGSISWWRAIATPRPGENGDVVWDGVRVEITEQKRAQEGIAQLNAELEQRVAERTRELRQERDKAASYLDIANAMFLGLDRNGNVTLINRKLCEVLGYTEKELLGQDWHMMCVPSEAVEERKRDYLSRFAIDSKPFVPNQGQEFLMVTKSGAMRTVSWSDSPIRDDDGKLVGVLGAAEDVTDQRLTELELRRAQRSEALANLAGGISHSLNNLLVPIVALADMLVQRLPEDSVDRVYGAKIMEAGQRATDLVKRILAFSRHDEPQPVVCDIATLLGDAVELLRQTVASTISIDLEMSPMTGKIFADPVQIESVVMNLVTNAVAAIGESIGHVAVDLDCRKLDASIDLASKEYACITVTDDGPGMAPDVLESIFNPFFTTKDVGQGTGLGLSVAESIVKQHGGAIRARSKPGEGAQFEVYLPLHDVGA